MAWLKKYIICGIILIFMLSPVILSISVRSCDDCVGDIETGIFVELDTFPVDLDLLFWEDQPSVQANYLNGIENGTFGWMLTPWGGHFISNHFEGADKWYFYCGRPLEVRMPIGGKVKEYRVNDGSSAEVLGNDVVVDTRLVIDIGDKCSIKFEHLTILASVHEQVKDERHTFSKGDLLGYPTEWTPELVSIDFHYQYNGEDICPYPALSSELQVNVSEKFDLQYQRAKLAGVYPESKLCNNYDIYIEESIWGVWEYKSGPYDSVLGGDRPFGFQPGGFTMLNRNLTNPETFWRDLTNPSQNMTEAVIGVFTDGNGDAVSGYDKIGTSMVELVDGDEMQGILKLTTANHWDWGFNTSLFMRFSLDLKRDKLSDDTLRIEYFDTLITAQGGFTSEGEIYYTRFTGFLTWADLQIYIILGSIGLGVILIGATVLIILRIRKKRKSS